MAPRASAGAQDRLLGELARAGVKTVYAKPSRYTRKHGLSTMHESADADMVVGGRSKKAGARFKIRSNADIDALVEAAERGVPFAVIESVDWKIIPLENIIARARKTGTRIYVSASSPAEARKMFSVLEVGVDGVILPASSAGKAREILSRMGALSLSTSPGKILEIKEVGDGERVCVDTVSMLGPGEGMLVGSSSNFMFLVHNESVGSSFTSPRPFRVNAGAVHCYTLAPDGTTRYLSELESGSEVLVVGGGRARRVAVGRSKIERRPMLMVKASAGGRTGGIIAQDAETIRFVRPDGRLVPVTHLKEGDRVMVHSRPAAGRHFGVEVSDESILEK